MTQADFRTDRRTRWTVAGVVLVLHLLLVAGLIRAFTPKIAADVVETVLQAFTVNLPSSPAPSPTPSRSPIPAPPAEEGQAGSRGKKASPRDAAAPRAKIRVMPTSAPPIAGRGNENSSGARAEGEGTGASGTGAGTGAGTGGAGTGGGGSASPTVKIAGDINSAKDYPRAGRDLRIGAFVTVDLTVGIDGLVKACRIVQPSPDPEADRITCDLATRRFRFRPAHDASGMPKEATFRWRQRWFY